MNKLIFLSLIFFFSSELRSQTELIVFSEDNELFLANLNGDNLAKEVSNFFEFTNVNFKTTVLEVTLDSGQKLKKTISLKEYANIYSITNVDDNYKIEYRGNYNLDEELPQFEYTKDLLNNPGVTIDYSLVSVEKQKVVVEEDATEETVNAEKVSEEETEDTKGVKVAGIVAVVAGGEATIKEVDEKVGEGSINDVEEPVKSKVSTEVVAIEAVKEEEEPVKPKVATAEEVAVKEEEEPVKPKEPIVEVVKEEEEEEEIDRATNKLVNINIILDAIEGLPDDKSRTKIMVKELNKGKYNCRQLKFLFTKITSDYSKLYTFKSTVNSCLDKNNLMTLKSSFKTKKYKTEYVKLVSKL